MKGFNLGSVISVVIVETRLAPGAKSLVSTIPTQEGKWVNIRINE